MCYETNDELPERVRDVLPDSAQDLYREAFNDAWERYADLADDPRAGTRRKTAHGAAWDAVNEAFEKRDDEWVRRDRDSRRPADS